MSKTLSGPFQDAVHKEKADRSKPTPVSAAKGSLGPPQIRSATPKARSVPVKAPALPPEAESTAHKAQSAASQMRPASSTARPVHRPEVRARPKHRAEVHHTGKRQRRATQLAAQRKVPARKVPPPKVRHKAPAPAAPRHSNKRPAEQSAPTVTASIKRAQPAVTGASPAGATARAAANAASANRGPVKAQWGAADGPHFLHRVMPSYPRLARRLGKQGTVLLQVTIDKRGRPGQVTIVKGAGFGFDQQARRAVQNSLFTPARRAGTAVACKVLLPVRFILRSSP